VSTRRRFLGTVAAGSAAAAFAARLPAAARDSLAGTYARLDAAAERPVLDRSQLREPLVIERIEFLRHG
jgi:hypothetical protein